VPEPRPWTSAVLIALPELTDYTDRWRTAWYDDLRPDVSIADQVPPHVTVLAPWAKDPADAFALARLAATVGGFGRLDLRFETAGAFGNGVVFLQPEPIEVLTGLLRAVAGAFPEFPPYGGDHPDPHPHVTVSARGGAEVLAEVEAALATEVPPRVSVDHLGIYAPSADGVWRERGRVPLRPGTVHV
jgi:2'-5' RNA ligase